MVSLLESRPFSTVSNGPALDVNHLGVPSPTINSGPSAVDQQSPSILETDPSSTNPSTRLSEDDILRILDEPKFPSAVNNCESILRWPIFNRLSGDVRSFVLESTDSINPNGTPTPKPGQSEAVGRGIQEDDFVPLSKRFLAYVHIKNPVLDIADFQSKVRSAVENGPTWDGSSCLVASGPN